MRSSSASADARRVTNVSCWGAWAKKPGATSTCGWNAVFHNPGSRWMVQAIRLIDSAAMRIRNQIDEKTWNSWSWSSSPAPLP